MFLADLHLHSPYSQATSKYITLEAIKKTAQEKGIALLGTGDCLHPIWLKELKDKLVIDPKTELYHLFPTPEVFFIPTVEVCCNFNNKKIHVLIVLPTLEDAEKMRKGLNRYGNLDNNGRPDLSISLQDLNEKLKSHIPDSLFIPAHILTPWYGMFGSTNHVDSIYDLFTKNNLPDALETGLSADIKMIRSIPELKSIPLVSFSDAHSLDSIGREVTVFDCELTYQNVKSAIQSGQITTLEYPPQLGKYYLDGHRQCEEFSFPDSSALCSKCGKKKTLGVLRRVDQLSNGKFRPDLYLLRDGLYFACLSSSYIIPLRKIISTCLKVKTYYSKQVSEIYKQIISYIPEIKLLTATSHFDLEFFDNTPFFSQLSNFLFWFNKGKLIVKPGYDGLFGEVIDPLDFCYSITTEMNRLYKDGFDCPEKDKKRFKCSKCKGKKDNKLCEIMKFSEKLDSLLSN
jgi:uncharacterized protein (TIGR00375 family)